MSKRFKKENNNKKNNKKNIQKEAKKACISTSRSNRASTTKWTPEEDQKLFNLLNYTKIKYKDISKLIPGHSYLECRKRWNKLKLGLIKGQWTLQEDRLLEEWVKNVGPRKWKQCAKNIYGRSGKQCREHWSNCLNPKVIRGEWTYEEDYLIMQFYEKYNGSWKKMIGLFKGRTENSIKNRFYSQLRKIAMKNIDNDDKAKYNKYIKIKLDKLIKFLKEALSISKKNFLKENPMTEEELKLYLKQQELKINQKVKEKNDELSTFLKKRKRTKEKNQANNIEKREESNIPVIDINIKKKDNKNKNNSMIQLNENNFIHPNNKNLCNSIINEDNEIKNNIYESAKNKENNIKNDINNDKYKNSNPFDLKFEEFYEPYPKIERDKRKNSFYELPIFNNTSYDFYDKPYIDFISDKKYIDTFNNEENLTFYNEEGKYEEFFKK